MPRTPRLLLALLLFVLAGTAAVALAVTRSGHDPAAEAACPPGYTSAAQRAALAERERRFEALHAAAGGGEAAHEAERAREAKGGGEAGGEGCMSRKHPESLQDLAAVNAFRSVRASAPFTSVHPGAYAAATAERSARAAEPRTLAGSGGSWQRAGKGPLVADDQRFGEVNGLGLGDLAGRITDFSYDAAHDRVYASVGEGGVWVSDDRGGHWRSIGEGLPTQAVGSVAVAPAKGDRPETLVALTGDDTFGGGSTYSGLGVYRSTDGGQTWQHSTGVPNGLLGFRIKVDPANADVVYAATGRGLYRSADGGASFENVVLPTGDCAGDTSKPSCFLANMVTDVAIQAPGGTSNAQGGAVTAAVGWRAGNKTNVGGFVESPNNGIYVSADGTKGSFQKVDPAASGLGDQGTLGRIEMGGATGPRQDHGFLYAVVQDASGFKKGEVSGIDVPAQSPAATPTNTYLKGVYVSKDFGRTWTQMATPAQLQAPTTGSALAGVGCATLYCPGVQAWYNQWIEPDPSQADAGGVPTRLTFGLEEVWQNDDLGGRRPQDGPGLFKVIGRYFGGSTCQMLKAGLPACPSNRGEPQSYTTHPDQHSAAYLPAPEGGSTLLVGNDGGAFRQSANRGEEFSNAKWGRGSNDGFDTLLPYDARAAKDGTIYAGLQDNGQLRIEPGTGKQVEIYGGDGGYSAVDPDHSDIAYEEYVLGDMRATKDGGQTWTDITPPTDTYQFINPYAMDSADAQHLVTAGTKVYETRKGPNTTTADWQQVFALGKAPSGAPNQMSAIDTRSYDTGRTQGLPTGPKTADQAWTGGAQTLPDAGAGLPTAQDDHPFTIGKDDGDATATIDITWADATNDWDLSVLRKDAGGSLVEVGRSAQGNTTSERVVLTDPQPGDYVVRVLNYAATGTYDGKLTFTQRTTDPAATQSTTYVGYCGYCDVLNTRPFDNGVATNAGGTWHIATAAGLPRRYITSIKADPVDPRTVYVTLGGYSRRWLPVGALGESTRDVGSGHVFRSTDAGESFADISGDLPDAPAEDSLVRNGQLVVATDVGVFTAGGTAGGAYQLLGRGLPTAPVYTIALKPKATDTEPDTIVAATQGRGVWTYVFAEPAKTPPPTAAPAAASSPAGARSAAAAAPRAVPTGAVAGATASRRPLVTHFALSRAGTRALRATFRAQAPATVRLTVQRAGRTVRTVTVRAVPGTTRAVRLPVAGSGRYRVTLSATPASGAPDVRSLAQRL